MLSKCVHDSLNFAHFWIFFPISPPSPPPFPPFLPIFGHFPPFFLFFSFFLRSENPIGRIGEFGVGQCGCLIRDEWWLKKDMGVEV